MKQTILSITRPKSAYGRQGLAGSWGKDIVRRVHFGVFSGDPPSDHEGRPGTMKNQPGTMKKPTWNHEKLRKPTCNHEKP